MSIACLATCRFCGYRLAELVIQCGLKYGAKKAGAWKAAVNLCPESLARHEWYIPVYTEEGPTAA